MFKIALTFLLILLVISIFSVASRSRGQFRRQGGHNDDSPEQRHISKTTGEYVEFEELEENK
jgi:hypothetical protein